MVTNRYQKLASDTAFDIASGAAASLSQTVERIISLLFGCASDFVLLHVTQVDGLQAAIVHTIAITFTLIDCFVLIPLATAHRERVKALHADAIPGVAPTLDGDSHAKPARLPGGPPTTLTCLANPPRHSNVQPVPPARRPPRPSSHKRHHA
jgi:hypothetical protein